MKRLLCFIWLFTAAHLYAQTYIPMPADSGATWRYRYFNVDDFNTVIDFTLYENGRDTVISGHTYSQIWTRKLTQFGSNSFDPPLTNDTANSADTYYGAIRDSAQKVYFNAVTVEQLILDFSGGVGSYVPSNGASAVRVVSIDSVLVGSVYHKRYNTADTAYYMVEGVGSNLGLLPQLNDGSGSVTFYCFTHGTTLWSPDTSLPCTTIASAIVDEGVKNVIIPGNVEVFPNPAHDYLHIEQNGAQESHAILINYVGQKVWEGKVTDGTIIPIGGFTPGVYYLNLERYGGNNFFVKIVIH